MDRAKIKLADAAVKAKGKVADALVVSAVPELKDERPQAAIVLLVEKPEKQFSTVSEPLD
jgi:hypothetical protein